MFQSYHPVQFNAQMLDKLLSQGWFRGGNVMYQSKMLCLDEAVYSVVNIRSNLSVYSFPKRMRKLLNKNKKQFSYHIQPLEQITSEMEKLYQEQSQKFKGFVHSNLENYLFEGMQHNFFNTYELTVFEGNRLVAVSFFDMGDRSFASLLGLYDQAYKKYSLGIFTMLLEIEYALELDYEYYYPGYVFRGSNIFDYKLKIGQIEYYDWNGDWYPLKHIEQSEFPAQKLKAAFTNIEAQLTICGISYQKFLYPYFSLGYASHLDVDFLNSLQFLQISDIYDYDKMLILSYNSKTDQFSLLEVRDHSSFGFLTNAGFSNDIKRSDAYFHKLLGVEQVIHETLDVEEMVTFIQRFFELFFRKKV
ncbi:MAG: hypothetical protein WD048_03740 [Chitinophagales bacterium]